MVWTGYTNSFNANPSAVRWGLDIDDNTRRVWTVEPTGDETKSQIISIDSIVLPIDRKAVDVRVTIENTELINSARLTDMILDEFDGFYMRMLIGLKAKIIAYGEASATDEIFVGTITEVDRYSPTQVTLTISDNRDSLLDQPVGAVLTDSDYSDITDEAVGRMKPIIFGEIDTFKPILVQEAAVTTLTADLEVNNKTIYVDDTSAFPSSGSLIIGFEEIAYTSKTATTFVITNWWTGRGVGSTDPEFHKEGTRVYEKRTVRFYVAEHAVTAIGNIYGYNPETDTYHDITSSATKNLSAPANITFAQMPRFQEWSTGRSFSWGAEVNPGALIETNPTLTNGGFIIDGNRATSGTLQNPAGGTPLAQADGSIQPAASTVPYDAEVVNITVYAYYGGASDTVGFEVDLQLDPGGGNQETLTFRFDAQTSLGAKASTQAPANSHTRGTFTSNNPNITIRTDRSTANGLVTIAVLQAKVYVGSEERITDYTDRPFRDLMIEVTGLQNHLENGGSIIDDILQSASFTSAGLAAADINSSSITAFDSARAGKYCGAIMEKAPAREIIEPILDEMAGGYYWDRARKFKLYEARRTNSASSDRTLTDADIYAMRTIRGRRGPIERIYNKLEYWAYYNWFDDTRTYAGSQSYGYSVTKLGARLFIFKTKWVQDIANMFYIKAPNPEWPWDFIEIDVLMKHIDLERMDQVKLDSVHSIFNQFTGGDIDSTDIVEIRIDPMRNIVTLVLEVRAF